MTPKVPMRETATATAGITVERTFRRNAKTTSITRPKEMRRLISTSLREPRIGGVRSWMMEN